MVYNKFLTWLLAFVACNVAMASEKPFRILRPTTDHDEFCYTWLMEIRNISRESSPDDFEGILRKSMLTLYDALLQSNPEISGSRAVGYQLKERLSELTSRRTPEEGYIEISKATGNGMILRTSEVCIAVNLSGESYPWVSPETEDIEEIMKMFAGVADMLIITDPSPASCDPQTVNLFRKAGKPVFAPEGMLRGDPGVTHMGKEGVKIVLPDMDSPFTLSFTDTGSDEEKIEKLMMLKHEALPAILISTVCSEDDIYSDSFNPETGGILIAPAWQPWFDTLVKKTSPLAVTSCGEHALGIPYSERGFMNVSRKALEKSVADLKSLMIPGETWAVKTPSVSSVKETETSDGRSGRIRRFDLNGREIRDISGYSGIYIEKKGEETYKLYKH